MLNNGQEPELMVIEKLLSEKLFLDNRPPDTQLSVTRIVKFHVPAADESAIRPAELMPRPEGNDPETMLKVHGRLPPDIAT